jgi:hypothetical protein
MSILANTNRLKISRPMRALFLLLAGIVAAGLLAAVQSLLYGGNGWLQSNVFLPNFYSFLLPAISCILILALTNRWWLHGQERGKARCAVWAAFGLRLFCLLIVPLGLTFWGYPTDSSREGIMSADAFNAVHTAWADANSTLTIPEVWNRAAGDNTGGITVIGVIVYRLASPDAGRPLLLGLVAALCSTLTVAAAYRFGELVFPRRAADIAAWIVALYPEAALIGSSHLQLGYLAALLGLLLFSTAALFIRNSPQDAILDLPPRPVCLLLALIAVGGMYFISNQFFQLTLVVIPISLVWFSHPRTMLGRWIWLAGAGLLLTGLVLIVLAQLQWVPRAWDLISLEGKYLFGAAWTEYDKAALINGSDMFAGAIASLPRDQAFIVAGFYGLLQPVLPAAIGYRNLTQTGGAFWQVIGIFRGLGWYAMLLLVGYASLRAIGSFRSRHPALLMAFFFWGVAFIGSYRALGDQWDNPRYRLFALIPMALLAAWGWLRFRQKQDIWFYRILWPYVCGIAALTVWYVLRYYFSIKFPALASLATIAALSLAVFFCILLISYFRKPKPAE